MKTCKYKIWLMNHFYYSEREFDNLEDAIKWAQSAPFDCRIDKENAPICSVSYFGVVRYFQPQLKVN